MIRRSAWILFFGAVATADAGFELAKGVYPFERFAEVQTEAKAKNKPITFLYSDAGTTCGLCAHASKLAMEEFRRPTVVVYVPPGSVPQLPAAVQSAIRSEAAGRFIPITVITDPAAERVLAVIPYARSPEYDQLLKRGEREMKKAMAAASGAPAPDARPVPSPAPARPPAEMRTWRSAAGAEVEARFVRQTGGVVVLEKADGVQVRIRASDLSAEDLALLGGAPVR